MVKTKSNFKPCCCDCSGAGKTLNKGIVDADVLISTQSEKISITALNALNKLEQPTPFQHVPESVLKGAENS